MKQGLSKDAVQAITSTYNGLADRQMVKVHVQSVEADIIDLSADAIVNPWNRNYWPRWMLAPGGLSGQLKERSGEEPWRELAKLGMLPTGEVVVTGVGNLSGYRVMFHAIGLTFGWKATAEGVSECARNMVRCAVRHDVRSVNVPLIGAGHGKLPAAESEEAILRGLRDVAQIVSSPEMADIQVALVRYPTAQ